MIIKKHRINIAIVIGLLFFACSPTNNDAVDEINVPDSVISKGAMALDEGKVGEIVENISSPVEMAAMVRSVGSPFSRKYICNTKTAKTFNTNFKKALGLGFLGADLGYLNIYGRNALVINHIEAIKQLADGLRVGHFFSMNTMQDLARSNTHIDSLMFISLSSFNQMDNYLRENGRSYLSSLIVAGIWLESMYMGTQVAKEIHNDEIIERIGEQKLMLSELIAILKYFEADKNFNQLVQTLEEISKEFEGIEMSYTYGKPESVENDGNLLIIPNETSHVNITDEQLERITNAIAKVRNEFIES